MESKAVRRNKLKLIPLLLLFGMFFYVFVFTPFMERVFAPCPFHLLTGYDCPGCGMTRASVYFLSGEWEKSFSYHPGGSIFVIWLMLLAFIRTTEFCLSKKSLLSPTVKKVYTKIFTITLFFLLAYGLIRLGMELAGVIPVLSE